jgi:hypothetical protein
MPRRRPVFMGFSKYKAILTGNMSLSRVFFATKEPKNWTSTTMDNFRSK